MVSRSFVLGYHGCDAAVVREIVSGDEQLFVSKNEYDWLGSGQYFWEDSCSRALRWAKDEEASEQDGKTPFDTVRAFFVEGQELYTTAGLRSLDHIHICVRNPRSIIGYFLPREI